ncbi:MAG: helix-turn-helix transcriptional regulator, partial [bacterium]|nr:helix-turn-helix transcriptional regulator [bacterium]
KLSPWVFPSFPKIKPFPRPLALGALNTGSVSLTLPHVMMAKGAGETRFGSAPPLPLIPSPKLARQLQGWLRKLNPYDSEKILGPDHLAQKTGDLGKAIRAAARLAPAHVTHIQINLLAERWDGFRSDVERALASRRSLKSFQLNFTNGDRYRVVKRMGEFHWEKISNGKGPKSSFPSPAPQDSKTETFFISSPWREVSDIPNVRTFLKELRREKVKVPPEERVTVERTEEGILVKFGKKDYFYGYQDKDHRFFIEGGRLILKVGEGLLTIRRGGEELDYREGDTHKVFNREGASTEFTGETRPLTQKEVREEIIQDQSFLEKLSQYPRMRNGGVRKAVVSELENTNRESQIPFPILKKMGDYYTVDVRSLISAANRPTLIKSGLDKELVYDPRYPIYLETPSDLTRMKTYMESPAHRGKGSLGWLIWYLRKNPFNYETLEGLAQKLGVSRHVLGAWELNKVAPHMENLKKLSQVLGYPLGKFIQARNQTHFPEYPWVDLFGDLPIFFDSDPKNGDQSRLNTFLAPMGSLSQYLFAARKLKTANSGVQEAEAQLKTTPYYFRRGETHQIPPLTHLQNRTGWLDYFQKLGMPEPLIKDLFLDLFHLPLKTSHFALVRFAAKGDSATLARQAGIGQAAFLGALRGERADPKTLAAIRETFPEEDVASWYREQYPLFTQFFPEAKGESPVLCLGKADIHRALGDFSLAEHLFAYRMKGEVQDGELPKPLDYGA